MTMLKIDINTYVWCINCGEPVEYTVDYEVDDGAVNVCVSAGECKMCKMVDDSDEEG